MALSEEERSAFARHLKQTMQELGVHPGDLATLLQVPLTTVYSWTRGYGDAKVPAGPTFDRLCAELDGRARGAGAALAATIHQRWPLPVAPDGAPSPAPAPAFRDPPSNLPAQATSLIDRMEDVAAATRLLRRSEVRLLTLCGPGGVGKTRLALRVAADLPADFPDGICFVALAPLADPAHVLPVLARALGLQEAGGRALAELLAEYLRDKRVLLLLDNFEQVLSAGPAVADLLRAAPALKVLVTSRARLHLAGEYEYVVPPLAVPGPARAQGVAELQQYPAVALFVARGQAPQADFALTSANVPAVAEICRRLDGLPLAIELAAARSRIFSPQAILARLERRLPVLTGGPADAPARQQTLRNTLDWSYALLDAGAQQLFRRLAVFRGGAVVATVEAVLGRPGAGGPATGAPAGAGQDSSASTLDALAALADQSLLYTVEGGDGEPRFGMLETIREYALEQLARTEEAVAIGQQHARYFLALAEQADAELSGPRQQQCLAQLEAEHDNLRAGLTWAVEHGDGELALRLAGALATFWEMHGHLYEGRRWLSAVLAASNASPAAARVRALNGAGKLAESQGDLGAARALLEEGLAASRALQDRPGLIESLNNLGNVVFWQGDYATARALHEEELALLRGLGDPARSADTLYYLGNVALAQNDLAVAGGFYAESLALARAVGARWRIALLLGPQALVHLLQGDVVTARRLLEESLALYQDLGDRRGSAVPLYHLGGIELAQNQIAEAHALYAESLARLREIGDQMLSAYPLEGLAAIAGRRGHAEDAARWFGAAAALREAVGAPLPPVLRPAYEAYLAAARAQLPPEVWAAAWEAGRALSWEQATVEAGTPL